MICSICTSSNIYLSQLYRYRYNAIPHILECITNEKGMVTDIKCLLGLGTFAISLIWYVTVFMASHLRQDTDIHQAD